MAQKQPTQADLDRLKAELTTIVDDLRRVVAPLMSLVPMQQEQTEILREAQKERVRRGLLDEMNAKAKADEAEKDAKRKADALEKEEANERRLKRYMLFMTGLAGLLGALGAAWGALHR